MGFTLIPVCQFHPPRLFLPSRLCLVPGFGNPTCGSSRRTQAAFWVLKTMACAVYKGRCPKPLYSWFPHVKTPSNLNSKNKHPIIL